MVSFTAILERFDEMGEKTGWTYVYISSELAEQLKPGFRKAFRIRGKIDKHTFKAAAIMPMGSGDYIFAINAEMRKAIRKQKGDSVELQIEEDTDPLVLSGDFMVCLAEEPAALKFFNSLPKSHQYYFSKWIESAKTDATKTKRIAQAVSALAKQMGYGEMIKANKKPTL